jgi:hypothetical protein
VLAFTVAATGDYSVGGAPAPGNAWPPIDALLHADLSRFFAVQPLLGPVSLALRAPFAGAARLLGAGELDVYRAGAFACLLGPVGLGLALDAAMASAGRHVVWRWALALLCVVNPATTAALSIGHPEEPLAGALVVGAVLAAGNRPVAAGALGGIAVATKQWALLALPAVVLAARRRRVLVVLVALGAGAALLAPGTLADRGAADHVRNQVLDLHTVGVLSAWWPVAVSGPRGSHLLPLGLSRADLVPVTTVLSLVLALALWRRDRHPSVGRVLALLGLVLLLRCALDPSNLEYYAAGSVLAVACWDGVARVGVPLFALLYAASTWAVFGPLLNHGDDAVINGAFLALTALFAVAMGTAAFAPARLGVQSGA